MRHLFNWFFKKKEVKKEETKKESSITEIEQKKLEMEAKLKALNEIKEELKTILK